MCSASALAESRLAVMPEEGEVLEARRQLLECVCAGESVGGQTYLEGLLRSNLEGGVFAALVDVHPVLDLETLWPGCGRNLLWVRCGGVLQALKCLDLLLRDENFTRVLGDFRGAAARELRRVPSTTWYRLQRLAHQREGGCTLFTDRALVPCADLRCFFEEAREAADFWRTREDLQAELGRRMQIDRGGLREGGRSMAG